MKNKFLLFALAALPLTVFAQKKISIIPSVGYGFRTASLPSNITQQEESYLKGLKSGINFDIGAYYQLNNVIGLGVKYNIYSAYSSGSFSGFTPDGDPVSISLSTDDTITFVGPAFLYSNFNENTKHKLYYDMAIGVISYKSKTDNVLFSGSNLGLAATIGYMYEISPSIFIGPQVGYTGGTLVKAKLNGQQFDLPEDQKEALHRLTVSAGVTIRL
ncbi:hypothetical protein [Kaistella sp.]|uniref:hypothetical protein n=1 Tax=Kaistella sp. TaxID=2782235 RepID=UPI0035A05EB4